MIYLDNAATTRPFREVLREYNNVNEHYFGNPSSVYNFGVDALQILDDARHVIAESINAEDDEIYFTSGGSESNNWALTCLSKKYSLDGGIVSSNIEHKSILKLSQRKIIPVDKNGVIDLEKFESFYDFNTPTLYTCMLANNETGAIQPIKELSDLVHQCPKSILHVDAVQAYMHIPIDVKAMGIDSMSASAHKFHGLKGVGFLYIKKRINNDIYPTQKALIKGGEQESGLRAGTENVGGISSMATAVRFMKEKNESYCFDTTEFRNAFERKLTSVLIPNIKIVGENTARLPGHSLIIFKGVRSERMVSYLNECEIYVSGGSACSSRDGKPSHVLTAMGYTADDASCAVRFSFDSMENSWNDVVRAAGCVIEAYKVLKNIDN